MSLTTVPSSSDTIEGLHNRPGGELRAVGNAGGSGIVMARWPALGKAIGRYEAQTAESFSKMAYDMVNAGIVRHDDRQRLAATAESVGIRPFDAQLLIACAIRQWAMDHRYDASPNPTAPALSPEYRAWGRMWLRFGMIVGLAVILDAVILSKWLG